MAEFPSNFGDGEVWVPSEMLQNERYYSQFPSELTYMEELAQQLSAYALLERRSLLKAAKPSLPNPNLLLPEIRQPNQYVSIAHHNPSLGLGLGGGGGGIGVAGGGGCNVGCCLHRHHHDVYLSSGNGGGGGGIGVAGGGGCNVGCCLHRHHHDVYLSSGNGGFQFGSRPVFRYPTSKPAEAQVGSIVQARATILQRQQQMQNHSQNRFLPVQVSRSWMGNGFGRESGGTGVFLPRVSNTHDSAAVAATATARRKQHSMRNGGEETKHRGPVKKVAVGKQDQVSAEMGLPSDWTY